MKKNNINYFDPDYSVRMLPLVIAYCRDLKLLHKDFEILTTEEKRIKNLVCLDKQGIEEINKRKKSLKNDIDTLVERAVRWKSELSELNLSICSVKLGRVNIPVYDSYTESTIFLCVHQESNASNLEWHCIDDGHDKCLPYWYKFSSSNGLVIPGK